MIDQQKETQHKSQTKKEDNPTIENKPLITSNQAQKIQKIRKQQIKKQTSDQIYDVIIIGAGISGLMAADILLKQQKKVLVLESSSSVGGTIRNYTIGETMKFLNKYYSWLQQSQDIKKTYIEIGASEILSTHTFMMRLAQEYDLTLFPFYRDGKFLYFQNEQKIRRVDSLMDIYFSSQFQKTITKLLAKIENISKNIMQIHENTINNPSKKYYRKMLYEFIEKFDQMTTKQFLQKEIENQTLRKMVINQFQIVQSLSVEKLSILQVLMHGYGLENLRLFTSQRSYFTQTIRIKEGASTLINGMKEKVIKRAKKLGYSNPIIFKSPVAQIKNQINSEVEVLTNSNTYKCYKVFYTASIGRANNIKISKLSPSKRLIFQNQISEEVQKIFLIFESAFWRSKFSGSGIFSEQFPFSQINDVSPSNLCCGILCLVLCGKKPLQWQKKFQNFESKQQKHEQMQKTIKKLIAEAFLNGNIEDQNLNKMVIIPASLKDNFGYQTYTKKGICLQLEDANEDYLECYSRDEHNIIFLGGELSKKFSSCMEGAVRYTRQKIFKYLEMEDPWNISS